MFVFTLCISFLFSFFDPVFYSSFCISVSQPFCSLKDHLKVQKILGWSLKIIKNIPFGTQIPRLPDKRLKIVKTCLLTKSTCCYFTMPCHQTTEMTLITIIGLCEYVSLLFYCNSVVLSIGLRGTSNSSWEAMQFIFSHSKFALLLLSLWVDRMFHIDLCWLSFLCFDNNHFCSWLARDVTKPEQIITFTLSMKHSNATLTQNFSKAAVLYFLTFWVIIIFLWQIL